MRRESARATLSPSYMSRGDKMRQRALTAACLLAAAGIALAGCDGDGGSGTSGAAATVSAAATTAPATTAAPTGQLPDLTGMPLLAARTMAGDADFTQVSAHDATGAERAQVADGDWKVCLQQPAPGPAGLDDPIELAVVMIAEVCPAVDGTPAPTTAPASTPPPTATTHKPIPKPRPTATTHKATPKPKPKPTVGHTEPPVNDHNGATALCNDGTLSYSAHHQGTCSHHHGVAVWYK